MKLQVLFFSVLCPLVGGDCVEVELPRGSTVRDLLEALYERFPGLREWDGRIRVAADLDYVDECHVLSASEEVAVMPPVQGG
jgi:molybdopterin converting factor small subunit